MTDLVRPVAGQSLLDSDGAGTLSTTMMDSYADLIEENEDDLLVRTSPHIVTTDRYTDIPEILFSDGSSLTGWHVIQPDAAEPIPTLVTVTGQTAVQAYLKAPSGDLTPALYINLTEIGYPTGLDVSEGETVELEMLLSAFVTGNLRDNFVRFAATLASGVDMTGTTVSTTYTSDQVEQHALNIWYPVLVPVGSLTNIKSIGIKKVTTGGSGSARARWNLTNIRRRAVTPLDQAYHSQNSVAAVVPPSYTSTAEQLPYLPSSLKSIVDLRPSHAFITQMGGFKNTRDWGLDETGVRDVSVELQDALNSLSPGDTLTMPPTAIYRCDLGLQFNIPDITIDGQGAAITQKLPIDEFIANGTFGAWALNSNFRIDVQEEGSGLTLRNLRIYSGHITPQQGSAWTTATGGVVSGSTIQLDALNDYTTFFNYPGMDPLNRTRQDFVLSDTNHVPGDCVVTITDENGVVLATETMPTLTSTPIAYTVYAPVRDIYSGSTAKVTKATATANTITLTQMRTFGNCLTDMVGGGPGGDWEFGKGIAIANATNVTIEDVEIHSATGDGVWINNSLPTTGAKGVVIRRLLSRGAGRQGFAPCGGSQHIFEDCNILFSARHSMDFEPEFPLTSANNGIEIRNMVCWKCGLATPFQTSSAGAFARNQHINVDGLKVMTRTGGGIAGGWMHSSFTNVEVQSPSASIDANCVFAGYNLTLNNVKIAGDLAVGSSGALTSPDTDTVEWTAGNVEVKNVLFTKQINGRPYLTTVQPGVHLENVRISDRIPVDQTYGVSTFQILSDTTYTGLDLPALRALLPASYPGVAIGQPWFPGGLDLKSNPLSRVRSLSGGTTRGNNLGRFQESVTAAATSKTIAFPPKTYPNVFTIGLASSTGGTLTAGTYHYRFASRNRFGGPLLATVNQSITLTTGTAINVTIDGMYDVVTGIQIDGVTIYRGPASGNYTTRYDIVPTNDLYSLSGAGSGNNKRLPLKDLGTTISPTGNYSVSGYTFPYTSVVGIHTPVDETGFEPDTNYAVFVEPSWQTTWRVTARRRDGFDIEFGVPAPTGSNTLSWMIARF